MIVRTAATALVCALLCALLNGLGYKSKGLFATLCALLIFSSLADSLLGLFSDVLSLAERTGIGDATKSALRAVGLGYIFGITADICDSLGEKTISTAVTAVGRVQIFLVSYPYFEKIIAIGLSLVE